MNLWDSLRVALILCLFILGALASSAADQVTLELRPAGSQREIRIHSQMGLPVAAMYPEYTILRSTNLLTWEPVGSPVAGSVGVSDELLRVAVSGVDDRAFFKVMATTKLASDGNHGDAIFGYGTEFSKQLQSLGQLPLDEFVARYGVTNQYLPQLTFDPTTAQYWADFNLDPAVHNATNPTDPRLTDFRLNPAEFAVFQTNGFVVSPRLGSYSFADSFYKIYTDDLPVFFSADAALHAWHRSYITMLEELEETDLAPRLQTIVQGMVQQLPELWFQSLGTAVYDGYLDADYFLAVAGTLLTGTNYYTTSSQSARIQTTLAAISNLQPAEINLFGANRVVDFSQFQVRGHYTTSRVLSNYFRAMMWCGLADFRFTGSPSDNSLRELSAVVALHLLMQRSGQFANWQRFDNVVQMFVGAPDSLNFAQLSDILAAAGIQSPASLPNQAALQSLQTKLMSGQLGVQDIRSGYFFSPLSAAQIKLPRSFTFMGQRFTLDGWAISKCTFDSIIWDPNGIPEFDDKVVRRVPSALDVAFSVLGNSQIVPELAARIARTNLTLADGRVYWRDGKPYQHNLAAVRNVVDAQNASAWTNNIYTSWLAALREMSSPSTGLEYPQAMRTRAWAMKSLNTQLASWTELKHDTVLYAKQPYAGTILCFYPDGYVEPRPAFWAKMRDMALRTKDLMATLPNTGQFGFEANNFQDKPFTNSIGAIYTNRLQLLDRFANAMGTLKDISEKELTHLPLATNETAFLQGLMESQSKSYIGVKTYSGWYPGLFFVNSRTMHSAGSLSASDTWDPLVTDVHTDTFDAIHGDTGSILHEAVGNVHLLMIAVDCDGDRMVYAGPVLSHYEFELGPTTRMTDDQWKGNLSSGNVPSYPEWTRSYLIP